MTLETTVLVVNRRSSGINDGGTLRSEALESHISHAGGTIIEVQNRQYKKGHIYHINRYLSIFHDVYKKKPDIVVLTFPSLPFLWNLAQYRCLLQALYFFIGLRLLGIWQRFKIVIDVSDMPIYQSKELGFTIGVRHTPLHWFEKQYFRLAHKVWFPSQPMADIVTTEIRIDKKKVVVVVNGNLKNGCLTGQNKVLSDNSRPVSFVYAGDLRQDRGIKNMIQAFRDIPPEMARLSVCGINGEWLKNDDHIINLGPLSAEECNAFVSQADVGIIPYPPEGYYNLIFPTKLSLYITCGVPILTTQIRETSRIVKKTGIGFVTDFNDLKTTLLHICKNKGEVTECRRQLGRIRNEFFWECILDNAFEKVLMSDSDKLAQESAYV